MKTSMVAMSGAIMPEPLAMPLMVTVLPPSFTLTVAALGKVSVVMMALAAMVQVRARLGGELRQGIGDEGGIQRLADDAGRGLEDFGGLGGEHLCRGLGDGRDGGHPRLAGEGIGIAGIDDDGAGRAARQDFTHQSTGAERDLERVKQPATVVPWSMTASSTSGRFL